MDVGKFVEQNRLSFKQRNNFIHKLNELRSENLKLTKWLENKGLKKYVYGFHKLGYIDLESVQNKMLRFEIKDIISHVDGSFTDYQLLVEAVDDLKNGSQRWMIVSVFYFLFRAFLFVFKWLRKCQSCKSSIHYCILTNQFPWVVLNWLYYCCCISVRFLLLLLGYISYRVAVSRYNTLSALRPRNLSFFQYIIGYYLDPKSCRVEWLQEDKVTVGSTASFLVKVGDEFTKYIHQTMPGYFELH